MKSVILIAALSFVFSTVPADAKVLFQDDFDTIPPSGYRIEFGRPSVGPVEGLDTKALSFSSLNCSGGGVSGAHCYDQIDYEIDTPRSRYKGLGSGIIRLQFDILTRDFIGSHSDFHVFFDSGLSRALIYSGTGDIKIQWFSPVERPLKHNLGTITTFKDNEKSHFDAVFDYKEKLLTLTIDKQKAFVGKIFNPGPLMSIRFSQGTTIANQPDLNAKTYIDNIIITSED